MYSTLFCHQTFYPSELFQKFEEVRCGRVWKQHKHGIGELRHVFYAWINTGSGQKGSVIVARINTGSGRNRLMIKFTLASDLPRRVGPCQGDLSKGVQQEKRVQEECIPL